MSLSLRANLATFRRAVRLRLHARKDSEHEQALIRIGIGFLFGIYALSLGLIDDGRLSPNEMHAVLVCIAFCMVATLIVAHILYSPGSNRIRRGLGAVIDTGTASYGLWYLGESGIVLFAIYLWVILGNGFRYGTPYLLLSTALSMTGFSLVTVASPFWHQHLPFAVGLALIISIVPLYASTLIRKLNQALHRAEEASRAKSQFLARMSHELRTPLNGVTGMTHVLLQTPLARDQREMAETVIASGRMLSELINNVLDFSKLEAGKTEIESIQFDLHALLNGIITVFLPQARQKHIDFRLQLSPDVPFAIVGDPLHLRQILVNLVSNAIKFTETGYVELVVSVASRDPGAVTIRFEVQDTGIGIPQAAQERIFESFTQADSSTTRLYGGTGLGTTIARQLVELMGGELSLRSSPGQGSLFWFSLPFVMAAKSAATEPPSALSDCRTLVLATESPLRVSLESLLQRWSIPYDIVHRSNEAIRILLDASVCGRPYRAVLVDGACSGLRPLEFAGVSRSEADLYGLFLAVFRQPDDAHPAAAYLDAGYANVLGSPPDTRQLYNILHAVVAREAENGHQSVVLLAEHAGRSPTHRHNPLKILLAEDNPVNQTVIRSILENDGHAVTTVSDGEKALDSLEHGSYDLVIADLQMPTMSGLEALKIYNFSHTGTRVPWLILTADATRETLEECANSGADGFLTKPVNPTVLLGRVAQITEASRLSATGIASGQATSPELPLIDGRTLLPGTPDQHLGEREPAAPAIELFEENSLSCIERMQSGLLRKDYSSLRIAARALESYCTEVGADRLAQQAVRIHAKNDSQLRQGAANDMHELVAIYEETMAFVRSRTARPKPSA